MGDGGAGGRIERLTMPQIERAIRVMLDTSLSSAQKSVFALLLLHSDQAGNVGSDEAGRLLADGRNVAAHLGIGESTAHKAFTGLERAGYLEWRRTPNPDRFGMGLTGKIRINLTAS